SLQDGSTPRILDDDAPAPLGAPTKDGRSVRFAQVWAALRSGARETPLRSKQSNITVFNHVCLHLPGDSMKAQKHLDCLPQLGLTVHKSAWLNHHRRVVFVEIQIGLDISEDNATMVIEPGRLVN